MEEMTEWSIEDRPNNKWWRLLGSAGFFVKSSIARIPNYSNGLMTLPPSATFMNISHQLGILSSVALRAMILCISCTNLLLCIICVVPQSGKTPSVTQDRLGFYREGVKKNPSFLGINSKSKKVVFLGTKKRLFETILGILELSP